MVVINISVKSNSSTRIDVVALKDVNINDNVQALRVKLKDIQKIDTQKLDFIHRGNVLKDEEVLHDIGIGGGAMIYCFPKNDISPPTAPPLSLIEVQQLLVSLRTAVASPNFINYIERLRTPDQIARLVSECPALKRDPSSLAYIQDADLVSILQNADILSQVVEDRPVIGRILQIVCNLITSEISSPRRSHHVSYSMDALSDEEMEIDQNELETRSGSRRTGSSSFQPITPAQLAAALANAAGGSGGWGGPSSSSAPRSGLTTPSSVNTPFNTPAPPSGSGAGTSPGGSVITTEMFSQALQNALAASASSSSGVLSGGSPIGSNPPIENMEESLQLMREMGIPDEELSLQALQATNGDVQAAINLIYAQWMADD